MPLVCDTHTNRPTSMRADWRPLVIRPMNGKGDAVLERCARYFETIGHDVSNALPRGWDKAWLQVEMDGTSRNGRHQRVGGVLLPALRR